MAWFDPDFAKLFRDQEAMFFVAYHQGWGKCCRVGDAGGSFLKQAKV